MSEIKITCEYCGKIITHIPLYFICGECGIILPICKECADYSTKFESRIVCNNCLYSELEKLFK